MKRILQHFALWQAVCVLLVIIVLGYPFAPMLVDAAEDAPTENTTITDYRAEFDVDDNGDMRVTERLTVDFPDDYSHGIFRFFDRHDPNAPHLRRDPYGISVEVDPELSLDERLERVAEAHSYAEDDIEQARADNDRETLEDIANDWYPDYDKIALSEESQGRYENVQIGSQDYYLPPGEHVYILKYKMSDVLLPDDVGAQLIWSLIPSGWNQAIEKAKLTVNLPGPTANLKCTAGSDPCDTVAGDGTTTVTVSASDLDPRTPVVINTDVDAEPATPTESMPWSVVWEPILGDEPDTPWLNLGLAAIALVVGLSLSINSRDPIRKSDTTAAPVTRIGPAPAAYLLTKRLSHQMPTATILNAAAQDTITIERDNDTITLHKSPTATYAGMDRFTRNLALWVKAKPRRIDGSSHEGRESGKWLLKQNHEIADWARRRGYLIEDRWWLARVLAVIFAAAAAIVLGTRAPTGTIDALAPAVFVAAALYSIRPTTRLRRTEAGARHAANVVYMRNAIAAPEPGHNAREQFNNYLPWAVALACTRKWRASDQGLPGNYIPPWLYVPEQNAAAGSVLITMTSTFESTVGSSIEAYAASTGASSFGGSVYSGMGGGGGGFGDFSGGGIDGGGGFSGGGVDGGGGGGADGGGGSC